MEENRISQQAIKLEPASASYNSEDFFISRCNKDAYEALFLEPIGDRPYIYCLLIRGGKSSGKTALAQIFKSSKMAILLENLVDIKDQEKQIYIIDNCDAWSEVDLFHAINISSENKCNLVLFSDLEWKPNLLDLSSRINAIKQQKIYSPDDEMMEVMIASEFSKRSITISKDIISYIKPRIARSYISIKNEVKNIDRFCLENKKNVTVKTLHSFFESEEARISHETN